MAKHNLRIDRRFKNLLRNPFFWTLTLVGKPKDLFGLRAVERRDDNHNWIW